MHGLCDPNLAKALRRLHTCICAVGLSLQAILYDKCPFHIDHVIYDQLN